MLSIIIQATVEVSVPLELVITKLVPTVFVDTLKNPGVPPSVFEVKNILLFAVTEVFATVTVPPTKTAVPILALVPVLICGPLPIVEIKRLPVESVTSPVNVGAAMLAFKLSAVVTNAVVAICVVFVPATAVVESGVPVNVGEAVGAFALKVVKSAAAKHPATEAVAVVHDHAEVAAV